jgi:GTPase
MTQEKKGTNLTTATPVERCLVIYVQRAVDRKKMDSHVRLQENKSLAETMGLCVVHEAICILRGKDHPATLMGKGWIEKIQEWILSMDIAVVVIDPELKALQQRELEKILKCRVLDRTAVILEIFAQRARTAEGVLQVDLAKLLYQKSRLVKTWSHLERQRGGFGFLGGPGESQLELDRRMIEEKIAQIEKKLEGVSRTRSLHRKARTRVPYPVVALVGYTNAGKSTLFNRLTGAHVSAQDRPFETLDPTMRKITLPSGRCVILSDTVGFISDLPESLRKAFEATLEEVQHADLLLHIQDSSSSQVVEHQTEVLKILEKLECSSPVVDVFNKSDVAQPFVFPGLSISALHGLGLDLVIDAIEAFLNESCLLVDVLCPLHDLATLHHIHEKTHILSQKQVGDNHLFHVRVTSKNLSVLKKNHPVLTFKVY